MIVLNLHSNKVSSFKPFGGDFSPPGLFPTWFFSLKPPPQTLQTKQIKKSANLNSRKNLKTQRGQKNEFPQKKKETPKPKSPPKKPFGPPFSIFTTLFFFFSRQAPTQTNQNPPGQKKAQTWGFLIFPIKKNGFPPPQGCFKRFCEPKKTNKGNKNAPAPSPQKPRSPPPPK